jgi:hypothetical protein
MDFFSETKSKALVVFQEFRTMVETSLRRKIKAIRSDNGGEFICKTFKDHYKVKGI